MSFELPNKKPPVPEGALWFDQIYQCRATHSSLALVEKAFNSKRINPDRLYSLLRKLDGSFQGVPCPQVCALAIQTLKRASFLDLPWSVNKIILSLVYSIWRKGRMSPDANTCLNPDKFLTGWEEDIHRVRPEVLGIYVRILSCEELDKSPCFPGAIDSLCEFVRREAHPSTEVLDAVADALIGDVLGPLVDSNLKCVLEFLVRGADLATRSAAAGGGTEGLHQLDAITQRIGTCEVNDSELKDQIRRTFAEIYQCLNSMHNEIILLPDARYKKIRQNVEPLLASIIPKVQYRQSRPVRQRPNGWPTRIRALVAKGVTREWTGEVRDLCRHGHGAHIKFHSNVVKCEPGPGPKRQIGDTDVHSIELAITEKDGTRSVFREASLVLRIPPGHRDESPNHEVTCSAWSIRGWNYLGRTDEAGALFYIEQEPDELKVVRESLPPLWPHLNPTPTRAVQPQSASKMEQWSATEGFGVPLPKEPESILDVIGKWFGTFADSIRLHKRWTVVWPGGEPTDERAIDGLVRADLQKYVESRGGYFVAHESSGLGTVDYTVSFEGTEVVVELKLGHGKWKQGIGAELPTYMKAKDTRYGIFVVFDFDEDFGKESKRLKELLELQMGTCSNEGVRIGVAIVPCDKPTPGSKRKTPARDGEGFQWHRGTGPALNATAGNGSAPRSQLGS
jgi:hypothetical protein